MKFLTIPLQISFGDSVFTTIVVTALIYIGVLFVFFLIIRTLILWYWKIDVIVDNQATQIKNHELTLRRDARANYYKNLAIGEKEKAYECLLYMFYFDLTDPNIITKESREKKYQELKKAYGDYFTELGHDFPNSIN